jgi:hypothetical protein
MKTTTKTYLIRFVRINDPNKRLKKIIIVVANKANYFCFKQFFFSFIEKEKEK